MHNRTHGILNAPEFSNGGITLNETQGFQLPTLEGINDHANATVVLWYKTKDTQELWVKGPSGSYYIGACHPTSNYYHQGSGSPTYYIDGIQRSHPKDHKDGEFHMFEAKNVDFRAWNQFNWFLYGSSWNMNGTVAKIMVYDRALTSAESLQNYYQGPIVTDGLICAIDAGNLISYEKGSDTAKSLVDVDTTATLINGVGFDKSNGGSWTFDGVDDYITLNNPLTVTQPYTILMWLKPDVLGTGASSANRSTPLKGNGHWNPGIWVTQDMIRSHGDTRYVDSYIDWSGLEYAQIGMIFDGTTVHNIFNGQILSNFLSNSYNPGVPSEILIGAESTGGLNTWDGSISNTTYYQRALTADEVQQNFNAHRNRFDL